MSNELLAKRMMGLPGQNLSSSPPVLRVRVGTTAQDRQDFRFTTSFRIGRVPACEVCVNDSYVSRNHAEITFENGQWVLRDLNSGNGIFVGNKRVQVVPIERSTTIRLGIYGPVVSLELEEPEPPVVDPIGSDTKVSRYIEHYFGQSQGDEPVGEHTMMVRRAFQRVQTKQKRKYGWVVAGLVFTAAVTAGYAFYLHDQAGKQKAIAQELFYTMKSIDVEMAKVELLVTDSNSKPAMEEVRKQQLRRKEMEKHYDRFLAALKVYDPKMTEQQRLILRIARIFGECELAMPPDFLTEIDKYIKRWQSTNRFASGILTAKNNGYTTSITQELLAHNLPPQFFYLALQESGFDPLISGPMTRKGVIAKGMWQFIPETGAKYGLKIGPLFNLRRPDTGDDRHHVERSTKAAARYLKDLYSTDAQASGLLVMACYNWGERSVLPLVRQLPANPRERNFWRLLSTYRDKIPDETYDYIFYIASAAVIGENPRLFGFDFDNPLGHLENR